VGCRVKEGEEIKRPLQTVHQTFEIFKEIDVEGIAEKTKVDEFRKEIESERTSIDHALVRYWGLHCR
jgi:hypothetical protein